MDRGTLREMIEKFFTPDEGYKKQPKRPQWALYSKHRLMTGIRATKRYADQRQKAPHNRKRK